MKIDADDPLGGGNDAADADQPSKKKKNSKTTAHPSTVEIDVPPLYRRAVEIDPASESTSAAFDREAAYRELFAAQRRAAEAARAAASAAAAAGIPDYAPPLGVQLDPSSIPRPDPEYASRAALVLRAAVAARASVERKRAAARAVATAPRVSLLPSDAPAAVAAGASVEVLWPDDGQWWPARVQSGSPRKGEGGKEGGKEGGGGGGDHLFYGTGEQERGVDLRAMAASGEIAWSGQERARCLGLFRQKQLEAEAVKKAKKAERAAARRAAAAQLTQLHQLQQMQLQQQQMAAQQQQQQGQQQQQQQLIAVQALVAAGAATRGAGVAIRLAATGQVLRGTVLGPVHNGSGLGVQLEGSAGEAARAVELRVERDSVDFHVFLELGGCL